MNPLFIITIFAIVLGDVLLSTSALRGERITAARWKDLFYLLLFLTCGWYFNHLNGSGVILYAALWLTGYLIASYNDSGNLSGSRVVLATLISSIALYILQKTSLLIHLDQGWLAFTTTVLFGVGETVFLLLLIFFTWDIFHAIGLQRGSSAKRGIIPNPAYQPFVSIHLPISNEPVDVVSKTLGALSQLSYPAYEVLVVDNNTQDPSVWMPVRAICEQLGFRFMHVDSLSGYKAGALEPGLRQHLGHCRPDRSCGCRL